MVLGAVMLLAIGPARAGHSVVCARAAIDGDTIVLTTGDTVRYLGIDTPEIDHERHTAQPLAKAAAAFNQKMVVGKKLRLEMDRQTRDGYGRLLAYVFLDDGSMINQRLLEQGLAFCAFYPPNLKYFNALLNSQHAAMAAKRGLWQDLDAHSGGRFIGNRRSLRFHTDHCPLGRQTSTANRLIFHNRREAFGQGFAPCKRCLDAVYSNGAGN
jgi:endonuclease YncB( thermonuclease family)